MIGSAISNGFEVIAVRKQAYPKETIENIVKTEGYYNLFSRGLMARMVYHSTQSVVFWSSINIIGRLYKVDLTEIA